MRVLITDGDNRSALAATRSLGQRGHEIFIAAESAPCLSSVSRHCARFIEYPAPSRDPDGFLNAVVDALRRHSIDVVLPMTEVTTLLLTQHQPQLPAGTHIPFARPEDISRASDKAAVLQLAASLGVPIPATTVLRTPDELESSAANITYPVVIKPARSRVRTAKGFVTTGVQYAHTPADLSQVVRATPLEQFPLLLQERIEGPGVGVFACYEDGRPIALFAHQRIREKPPSGGVSVLRESAPLDPLAVEHANRLLRALNWRGVAMVEFKRDRRDGSLRLMEINGRFWGSLQLAIDAGVDFPALLVDLVQGRTPQSLPEYRIGVRTRWFWGDVDALLLVLLRRRSRLNLPPSHPGRLRSLWDFLHLWGRDLHYEIFRHDDLRPWLLETRRWFNNRG